MVVRFVDHSWTWLNYSLWSGTEEACWIYLKIPCHYAWNELLEPESSHYCFPWDGLPSRQRRTWSSILENIRCLSSSSWSSRITCHESYESWLGERNHWRSCWKGKRWVDLAQIFEQRPFVSAHSKNERMGKQNGRCYLHGWRQSWWTFSLVNNFKLILF